MHYANDIHVKLVCGICTFILQSDNILSQATFIDVLKLMSQCRSFVPGRSGQPCFAESNRARPIKTTLP